jgi:hypothetical protein
MAAPNLRVPLVVTGKLALAQASTTLASVLANGSSSGKVLKVTTIRACNITASSSNISITVYRASTHRYLIKAAPVDAGLSLIVTSREDYIYLEEGDALYAQSSGASAFDVSVAYEEVS